MDTVTYPDEKIRNIITQDFVAVRVNTVDPDDQVKRLMRDLRMVWTPAMFWFDHHGIEVRRECGYLSPSAFAAVSGLAIGQTYLLHAQYTEAETQFLAVAQEYADDPGEEALFWAGVAALRRGSRERFVGHWTSLYDRSPHSRWAERSSFIRMQQ